VQAGSASSSIAGAYGYASLSFSSPAPTAIPTLGKWPVIFIASLMAMSASAKCVADSEALLISEKPASAGFILHLQRLKAGFGTYFLPIGCIFFGINFGDSCEKDFFSSNFVDWFHGGLRSSCCRYRNH
jgi:hypothetical protein